MTETGTAVDGGLGEVVRAVRDGTAAALRAGRSLAAASRAALRANDTLGPGLQDARRDVARSAGADAPAWSRARSWSEPLMVRGSESAGGDGAVISHQDGPARRRGDEPPARVQRP